MKSLIGRVVVALVLVACGEGVRRASHVEARLASAHREIATLAPEAAEQEYGAIEEELALANQLPLVGRALGTDVAGERAMLAYWRGRYGEVPSTEAQLQGVAQPDTLFLGANAAFRKIAGQRLGEAGAHDIDGVLRLYASLLRKDPEFVDAAYNYEYLVRLRNIVAKTKASPGDKTAGNKMEAPPPSVHGQQGSPPNDTPSDQFNIIVPLRPEERGELMKAGTGATRQRKG